jgi:hypothetical protein
VSVRSSSLKKRTNIEEISHPGPGFPFMIQIVYIFTDIDIKHNKAEDIQQIFVVAIWGGNQSI